MGRRVFCRSTDRRQYNNNKSAKHIKNLFIYGMYFLLLSEMNVLVSFAQMRTAEVVFPSLFLIPPSSLSISFISLRSGQVRFQVSSKTIIVIYTGELKVEAWKKFHLRVVWNEGGGFIWSVIPLKFPWNLYEYCQQQGKKKIYFFSNFSQHSFILMTYFSIKWMCTSNTNW